MDVIKFKTITSQEVEKMVHDQSFSEYIRNIAQKKTNQDGFEGVKTREIAQRVGIEYEMFRKILNRQKPNQPRDCIIAICAALLLSVEETNKALFYYDDLPRLDDTIGCRDFFIMQTLAGNIGRDNDIEYLGRGVEIVNRVLKEYDFSELRLSNKTKSKEPKITFVTSADTQSHRTFTEISSIRFDYHKSLCDTYHPYQYRAKTVMEIVDSSKEKCYLKYTNSNNRVYKYSNSNVIPEELTQDDELFLNYTNILKDTNLRELRSCYELIFDTRNYGLRTSAKILKDEVVLFSESYNYVHPERNEYFYGEKINGAFTFKILKKSGFMESYLSEEDFNIYFPHKKVGNNPAIEFASIEEVKEYCRKTFWNNPEIEWDYVKAFSRIEKRVEKLKYNLIEGKEFIRSFEEYFDDEPWRLYKFYNVFEEFGCEEHIDEWPVYKEVNPFDEKYGIDDGIPIGTFLCNDKYSWVEANKSEAEFKYKNQMVMLNFNDLKLAFELGINKIPEICKLKLAQPNLGNLKIEDFIK